MPNNKLVGLSLWQPWASLMVTPDPQRSDGKPPKEWETRSWYPHVLPPLIAIHATKGISREERWGICDGRRFFEPYASVLERCLYSSFDPWMPDYDERVRRHNGGDIAASRKHRCLPLGAIVGVGRIAQVERADRAAEIIGRERGAGAMTEIALGNYALGRYALRFADVRPLRNPVPCRGLQQLWPVPDEIRERVEAEL